MTATDMASVLDEVQAKLAGTYLAAEWFVKRSGTTIREVGTIVLDYTRTKGTWLISRQA
jgi:hypothetical protein